MAVHLQPAWRHRADFVIRARIDGGHHVTAEQLWARQIDGRIFEICCVPFHIYDLALGDVVETDATFEVTGVVKPSGHSTFRAWLGQGNIPPEEVNREELETALTRLGGSLEWSGSDLLAIDAVDEAIASPIAEYLWSQQQAGRLIYESGNPKRDESTS